MELMGYMGLNGAAWAAWGCMKLHADAMAALPTPPPLPAGPSHPLATSKGWYPYDGLGKPSLHMCTSGPCPKRPTRERLHAMAHTCCGGVQSIV
eukprot:350951-Chlamydomonas_euryale.AAC.12